LAQVSDARTWLSAVRHSHERMATLVGQLNDEQVKAPSYATEWTIAQVASHLGSQALNGQAPPGRDVFERIWDGWNAAPPGQQVAESVATNQRLLADLDRVAASQDAGEFSMAMFGMTFDLVGVAWLRLGEHAVHTWDIAVALDPAAELMPEAVELLIDRIAMVAVRSGRPIEGVAPVAIDTTAPARAFLLSVDPQVTLAPRGRSGADAFRLPASAFIRLVYGRLRPDTTPTQIAGDARLPLLREVFKGL
jgi:uncharacterized protein (TIGR03083 family)